MPRGLQEKLKVCPGHTLTQSIANCPFVRCVDAKMPTATSCMNFSNNRSFHDSSLTTALRARLDAASLPSFLGGRCHCRDTGGCVPGFANEQATGNLEVCNPLGAWGGRRPEAAYLCT